MDAIRASQKEFELGSVWFRKFLAFKINRPKIQVIDGRNNVKSTAQSVYFCPQNYILYVHAY